MSLVKARAWLGATDPPKHIPRETTLAKELEKFNAEFKKKIASPLKAASEAEAKKRVSRVKKAHGFCWEGEEYMRECMVPAHSAGITGTNLSDYMKNKEFKGGYMAFKKADDMAAEELIEADDLKKQRKPDWIWQISSTKRSLRTSRNAAKNLTPKQISKNCKSTCKKL